MNYQAKQEELDVKKWLVSEKNGSDACGDFDYCKHCDKTIEYPCAVAKKQKRQTSPRQSPQRKRRQAQSPQQKKPT